MNTLPLYLIPLLPLLGALLNGSLALKVARTHSSPPEKLVSLLGTLMPFLAFVVALVTVWPFIFHHEGAPRIETVFEWIVSGNFRADLTFRVDHLSSLMLLIVTGIGTLIHLYSTRYMHGEKGFARYFAYLNLFLFSMLLLILGDNLLVMFIGWEGVGLCSYLLIGFWFDDPAKASAGKKAFIVNRIGDFGFLLAIFIVIATLSGAPLPIGEGGPAALLSFSTLEEYKHFLAPVATAVCLLLFVGATGKSAQIPLYIWLPDAMAGPTPVSALIHAATMVTAGVYMIARLSFLFDLAPMAREVVATVGALTALFAATIGIVQRDIKKVLAYSTVSQLGYMFIGVGLAGSAAGIFHVITHAFFKACLFLGSGSVIHAMHHEQDIFKMGGLKKWMPITYWTFLISTLAIAGIPPFAGFFSKDEILWQAFSRGYFHIWLIGFLAAGVTAFYMFRLVALTFLGKCRADHHTQEHLHESPWQMTLPLIILAIFAVLGGLMGVPESLGGHNWIHHFLEGEAETTGVQSHAVLGNQIFLHLEEFFKNEVTLERFMAALSVLWAGFWASLSVYLYVKKPEVAGRWAEKCKRTYRLLSEKYYVDELYEAVFVKPIHWISEKVLWKGIDAGAIDGIGVNGSARFTQGMGDLLTRFQNGVLSSYALYFVIGIVGLLYWVIF